MGGWGARSGGGRGGGANGQRQGTRTAAMGWQAMALASAIALPLCVAPPSRGSEQFGHQWLKHKTGKNSHHTYAESEGLPWAKDSTGGWGDGSAVQPAMPATKGSDHLESLDLTDYTQKKKKAHTVKGFHLPSERKEDGVSAPAPPDRRV